MAVEIDDATEELAVEVFGWFVWCLVLVWILSSVVFMPEGLVIK